MGSSGEHLLPGALLLQTGQHRQAAGQLPEWLLPRLCVGTGRLWPRHVAAGALGVPPHPGRKGFQQGLVRPAVGLHRLPLEHVAGAGPGQHLCVSAPQAGCLPDGHLHGRSLRGSLLPGRQWWWPDSGGLAIEDQHLRPPLGNGDRLLLRSLPSLQGLSLHLSAQHHLGVPRIAGWP